MISEREPAGQPGCLVCGCTLVATVTLYGGRRCATHPDRYDPDIVMRLRLGGWNEDADAYLREWNRNG